MELVVIFFVYILIWWKHAEGTVFYCQRYGFIRGGPLYFWGMIGTLFFTNNIFAHTKFRDFPILENKIEYEN